MGITRLIMEWMLFPNSGLKSRTPLPAFDIYSRRLSQMH